MRTLLGTLCLLLTLSVSRAKPAESEEPLAIGSRRELFVDRLLIDRLSGAHLQLGRPERAGVAVRFDGAAEGPVAGYPTVFKDGDKYRMYYRGQLFKGKTTCYAESRDGMHWTKPEVGLVSVDGSTRNNAVLPQARQFFPFIDRRPGVPASERYKANSRGPEEPHSLIGFVSSDGVRWRRIREEPIVLKVLVNNFDSLNIIFWSEVEKLYVLYARHMVGGAPCHGPGHLGGLSQLEPADAHDLQRHGDHHSLG